RCRADRLRRLDLQAARSIEHAIDHHARFARRRPKPRAVTSDEPGAELEARTRTLHIGLDREPAGADEIREIVDARARGLHRALAGAALDLNALANEQGIDAVYLEPADMQAVRPALDQTGDAVGRIVALLDQACDDHAVG